MVKQIDAVYEQGVLRPLEPLALSEHQRVRLTLDDSAAPRPRPLSWRSSRPVYHRYEEFEWLANESGPYAGQWVALDGSRLVAHGDELATVSAAALAAGVEQPLFSHLPPEGEPPFGGW